MNGMLDRFPFGRGLWVGLALLATAAAMAESASPPAAAIRLVPGAPILVDPSEPPAVLRAVQDLQRDLKKVLGADSPVVSRAADIAGTNAIVVAFRGAESASFRDARVQGREAHGVFTRHGADSGCVVLQGADARGAIYALYTFSDRYLDVPPLWFWASWTPRRRPAVAVPADAEAVFGPPQVTWRTWFPNDMDLLRGWRRTSPNNNWDPILETMLRLKINVLDVGQNYVYYHEAGETEVALAARDRGLAVFSPYLAAFSSWNKYWINVRHRATNEVPVVSLANSHLFEEFWSHTVEWALREKLEMVWCVNFRASSDSGFWNTIADAPADDPGRAKAVEDQIRRQYALLKRLTRQECPDVVVQVYSEGSDYFDRGLLKLPSDGCIIWQLSNDTRDHFPSKGLISLELPPGQRIGYYFNIQFFTTGAHMADAEGPWKMEKNFRLMRCAPGGPLKFSMVNMGNVREFVMTAAANASMMWDPGAYDTDRFLLDFCTRYFGAEHAPTVAQLYRDYFNAYWQQRKPDIEGLDRQYLFTDLRISRTGLGALQRLAKVQYYPDFCESPDGKQYRIVPADNGSATRIEAVRKGTAASVDKFRAVVERCDTLLPQIPEQGRAFFNDNLRLQARFMLHAYAWMNKLAEAYVALPGGAPPARPGLLKTYDKETPIARIREAETEADRMAEVLKEAEHGAFQGWYSDHTAFKPVRERSRMAAAIEGLRQGPQPKPPTPTMTDKAQGAASPR